MADLVLECEACGHLMRVPEFALGSKGRCSRCNIVLAVTEANTRPFAEEKQEGARDETSSSRAFPASVEPFLEPGAGGPVPRPSGDACARCGRLFRGDWDRNETPEGVLCHICARMITETGPPLLDASTFQEPRRPPGSYFPSEAVGEEQEKSKVPEFAKEHPQLFKGVILAAGLGVIALGLYFAYFGGGPDLDAYTPTAERVEEALVATPALPYLRWVLLGLRVFFSLLGCFLALYWALHWDERLPGDTVLENIIALVPGALILTFPLLVPFFALKVLAQALLAVWVIWIRFESTWGVMLYCLLLIPANLLAQLLSTLVVGGIALILF